MTPNTKKTRMLRLYEHYPALCHVSIKTGHVALKHDPNSTQFTSRYTINSY